VTADPAALSPGSTTIRDRATASRFSVVENSGAGGKTPVWPSVTVTAYRAAAGIVLGRSVSVSGGCQSTS
jgi:hypothetical protein